jgi:hypothetical protein
MLSPDRFYKIFVSKNALYGVKIAGQIFDEQSADSQIPFLIYILLRPWIKGLIKKRYDNEELYRDIDLSNKKFLEMDKHNFMYDTHSVYEIKLNNKKSLHTYGQNNGILEIHMRDGKK